ncbi:MAG: aminotransferase class I/II-fold pyridoxal phosphate-dependent enzyme [Pirellulales bacterium]
MHSPPGAETMLNGQPYLYFAGTGYLGLQGHPLLVQAAAQAAMQFGVHTATSRSGFGTCPPVLEVERRAAELLSTEAACYLVSGYAGNFAVCAAISEHVDLALLDESAHDCLREAMRWLDGLKGGPLYFRHRDAGHVAELLAANLEPGWRALVMTDGVFPTSGHLAPLADYLSILDRYEGSMLLVDDAHGLAVLGDCGRGSLELAGIAPGRINRLDDETDGGAHVFHSTTLSKAVGGHGGAIAGSRTFLDGVCRASGWLRAASAPAAPVAAATAKGLEIVQGDPGLRRQLAANTRAMRSGLRSLGLDVAESPSPIVGVSLASADLMQAVQHKLAAEGIVIAYARDYAGAGPLGMLRIAVFATHTPEMIDRLVEALRRAI